MPRIRAGSRGRLVSVAGRSAPLSHAAVARAAESVLRAERQRVTLSITFLGRDRMRALNRRWLGARRPTDVLAFPLSGLAGGGIQAGDVYICPWVAAREARDHGITLRQELIRLVVHGVLHVLGYDHPPGGGKKRMESAMWLRQERYVRKLE